MRTLESARVSILGKSFQVFGYSDDTTFQEIGKAGTWNKFNLDHLKSLISSDDICLDLGANHGMMTLAMSVIAHHGHIFAFEASPDTAAALQETVRANSIQNVSASNVVVGRSAQAVKFFDMTDTRSSGHYVPMEMPVDTPAVGQDAFQIVNAQTRSVDEIVRALSLSKLDFIKIDVEGAELDVIEGAVETFRRFLPTVALEFNSYAFVHYRELAPRIVLRRIFEVFEQVYYFKNRTGALTRLVDREREREQFLHNNLFNGFVDDLLCVFSETRAVRSGALEALEAP